MPDRYANFAELADNERYGIHYRIRLENRGTPLVILAPHGGLIEQGTSEIAVEIALDDLSIYSFEGLRQGSGELHITSSRFDEPNALRLIGGAESAIAIHGRADRGNATGLWLGGRDAGLRDKIVSSLRAAGFEMAVAQRALAGIDPMNICNRGTREGGVQIEVPRTLRNQLIRNPEKLQTLGAAIRQAVSDQQVK